MHSIGTIRRLDDLGRIVIPKSVRHALNWQENDPIEISVTDDGHAVLNKYVPANQEGLIQITSQVEDLLRRGKIKGAAWDYLNQAFTELKCAVEALTLAAQDETEVKE